MLFKKQAGNGQASIDYDRLRRARIARANHVLHKRGIGAAIVYDWDSRNYLSAVWKQPHDRRLPDRFALLIRDAGFPFVHVTQGFDDRHVREDCSWLADRILTDNELTQRQLPGMAALGDGDALWRRCADQVRSLLREHGVADLPCSVDRSSPQLIEALEGVGLLVVDGNDWLQEARMMKTEDELALLRMAAGCSEAGYAALAAQLQPGMRQSDARAIMTAATYDAGAEAIEDWVIWSGPRDHNRSDRPIEPGDLLAVEARRVSCGGCGIDVARSFLVGAEPTAQQAVLYQAALELQRRVEDTLHPGLAARNLAGRWPESRSRQGSDALRVVISWYDDQFLLLTDPSLTLEENMVIACHVECCMKGNESVALGNTYRITDHGCECVCRGPWPELAVLGA